MCNNRKRCLQLPNHIAKHVYNAIVIKTGDIVRHKQVDGTKYNLKIHVAT